jgi:hypothetical protein
MNKSYVVLLLLLSSVSIIVSLSYTPNIFGQVWPYNQGSYPHQLSAAQFDQHRYVVYQSLTANKTVDILFKESHDNGTTFSNPVDLNDFMNKSISSDYSAFPQVGAFNEDVYVIWHSKLSNGNVNLFYIKSSDGGRTFENATNVSYMNNPGNNTQLKVMHSELLVDRITGSVYVAYTNDDGSTVPCHVHCDG